MRPISRLVPPALAILAACAPDASPTAPAADPTAPRPAVAGDAAAATVAAPGRVVTTTRDFPDPDAGRGPTFDDGVCDELEGRAVGGDCSLRGAIQNHNVSGGPTTIGFAIGAGVPTIRLKYDLPDIAGTVTIDGAAGGGGATRVELNGADITTEFGNLGMGLKLRGGRGSQIRNLVLNNFRGVALDIVAIGSASGENVIEGNYIGTDGAGTTAAPNGWGIIISSQPWDNPAGGNVIRNNILAASRANGVQVSSSGSRGNVIVGNRIGLGADGATPLPNHGYGVLLSSPRNRVGGPQSGEGNVIVATTGNAGEPSDGSGVLVRADSNRVERNLIGVAPGGRVLPNAGQGVALLGGRGNVITANSIVGNRRGGVRVLVADYGNAAAGPAITSNTIRDNRYYGVELDASWARVVGNSISGTVQADDYGGAWGGAGVAVVTGARNTVRANAIVGNAGLGIDVGRNGVRPNDPGDVDDVQNFPVVTAATSSTTGTTVRAALASRAAAAYTLDFYATQPCDSTGHGEGLSFVGTAVVTTDAAGNATVTAQFRATAVVGSFVTATATGPTGTTSEFSACRAVTAGAPNRPPAAEAGGPYSGNEGAPVAFSSAGSADPDSTTLTYRWEFGDGTASTLANPSKSYADNGSYKVRLTVTDPLGLSSVDSAVATIANVAPTGTLTAPTTLLEGTDYYTLRLTATDAGAADRASLRYAFDCGLGAGFTPWDSARTSVGCSEVPDRPLTVQAKVRDKDGGETLYTRVVPVTNAAPSVQAGPTTFTTLPVGATFSVAGWFVDSVDTDAPWRYSIAWGDGTPASTGTGLPWEPIDGAHAYARAGAFAVQLSVTDKDGGTGRSASIVVTVYAPSVPRIAFASTRDGNQELYAVNADGTGLTRLTNDLSPDREPAWSPDGARLAFVQGAGGGQMLRVMRADGTLLPGFIYGGGSGPAWSRSGKVAFLYGDGNIYVANPDGTGLERRTFDGRYSDLAWAPVWDPDGTRLAYTRDGEIHFDRRQLTVGGGRNAAWSPNGTRIAFVSDRAGNPEIYVMNADGSGVTRLTSHSAADVEPSWSPDGTRIAFVSDRDGVRDLYVMNADGSGVRRLPVGGGVSRPQWRP